jgi:hypothetical protein
MTKTMREGQQDGARAWPLNIPPTDGTERSLFILKINGECVEGRKQPFRKEREETVETQGGERKGKE